jgi:hypothetical protein
MSGLRPTEMTIQDLLQEEFAIVLSKKTLGLIDKKVEKYFGL